MLAGTTVLSRLLAVALPVVITVSFNSGAPHYTAYHQDAEPVEMCDWLSDCASPAWHDGDALPCTWRNATTTEVGDSHSATDAPPLPGNNGTDGSPECPGIDTRAGTDALRIVGGLLYPLPAAVSTCCLVINWLRDQSPRVRRIGLVSSTLASVCCLVLMVLYASRPVISGSGWDVAIRSPGTWVAVRTYFALSTVRTFGWEGSEDSAEGTQYKVITTLTGLLLLPPCMACLAVGVLASPVAAAHRILSTGEWGFAISSAALQCLAVFVGWEFVRRSMRTTILFLLIGPGSFAILTVVYFATTPTHTPLTSFWLPLGDPEASGFWSIISYMLMPAILGALSIEGLPEIPPQGEEGNTPGDVQALEMEVASSDDDELEEEEDEDEGGGCGAAGSDPPDGMPLSLRLPTGDAVVVCVAEGGTLGGLKRRALRELLSAATGGQSEGTAQRVHLSLGGVRLRGPAHTPLHTLPLESGCVVEVRAEAAPTHPASASDAQRDLLQAVRSGDAAGVAEMLRSQGRYPNMFHDAAGVFARAYSTVLPDAPDDVLHTLLRKARPTEACSVLLQLLRRCSHRLPTLVHPSGVLRRPAVLACVAETAEPWELYRLQLCTRRDLGFGVSLGEAVVAYARHSGPRVGSHEVRATLQSWGMGVHTVPPAARHALVGEEPPLWVPCLSHSSHPFSAVLLGAGLPLGEVPHAVTALRVVCAYSAVCVLCVAGVAYLHAAFQMVDDDSAWMTAVFVAVSGPFFIFDLLPEWVQFELACRIHSWWHRDTHQDPPGEASHEPMEL